MSDKKPSETETILMRSKTGSVRRLFYRQRNQQS